MSDTSLAEAVRAALRALDPGSGDRMVLAISGGADSTALAHLLAEEAQELGLALEVAVVDHGLRDVSEEIAAVRALAASLALPFHCLEVQVPADTGSLQAAARDARRAALRRLKRARGARWIALGHTRTDQTETLLLQLLRGTGLRGLAGMRRLNDDLFRPLLDVERERLEEWLRAREIGWVEDPTNAGDAHARNRIRHRLTPLLEELSPGSGERIAACATHLASDREALESLADRALRTRQPGGPGEAMILGSLREWPRGLWPHVLRQALEEAGGPSPDRRQIASLVRLIETDDGSRGVDIAGLRVERIYGELLFTPAAQSLQREEISVGRKEIVGPGCYDLGGGRWPFSRSEDCALQGGEDVAVFDARTLRFPLEVRGLREGDRMHPLGLDGTRLLSDILVDRKVPFRERNRAMVLTDGQDVLWLVGVMRSAHPPVGSETRSVLRVKSPMWREL